MTSPNTIIADLANKVHELTVQRDELLAAILALKDGERRHRKNHGRKPMTNVARIVAEPTLETLAAAWMQAKAQENKARDRRVEIEESIASLLPIKDEGTVSEKADGMKISVTYKLTRKANTINLRTCWDQLGDEAKACFVWKADVSTSALRNVSPAALIEAQRFITTAPAKPSVAVEATV